MVPQRLRHPIRQLIEPPLKERHRRCQGLGDRLAIQLTDVGGELRSGLSEEARDCGHGLHLLIARRLVGVSRQLEIAPDLRRHDPGVQQLLRHGLAERGEVSV